MTLFGLIAGMGKAVLPPTNLTATVNGSDIDLTWTAASGAESYNVYQSIDDGDWTLVDNEATTAYTVTPTEPGEYNFRVTSVKGDDESDPSNETSPTGLFTDVSETESMALLAFYNSTDGPNWTDYNWDFDTATTAAELDGVTVSGGHVTQINLNGDSTIDGDSTALSALTSLLYLNLYNTSVSGDISGFDALTSLTYLHLGNTSVSGDISGFDALTSLTTLYLYSTSVSGDISGFDALTSLAYLRLSSTSVSGDISGFDALTSLLYLNLYNTSVSGDISGFDALTSLTYLHLYNTSVEYTGTMANWNDGDNQVQNCAWSESEVDNFLVDLDATGVTDGTLDISGTNAAPTDGSVTGADGLAAITSLELKGWSVTETT